MNPPKGEQTIFAEALRLPPQERAAYLAQSTMGNPELREEVESLLRSYGAGEFLEQAAAPEIRPTAQAAAPVTERPGDTIGRYKLLQQIGEGGCGVVYMAEQDEPFHRRVALKIIKLGMDTKSVIARFEAERQALAIMDHPNIAKVFDAGATDTGRPYFVMELVRGMKITDYCDEKKLSTRVRLDLFIQVCQAIQHAHQKGIIHRDIKPSNILASMNDGVLVPKVIDFGIAKATTGQQLTDKTLFTAFEQFIGTPAYMSPEQAVITNVDIDTRSDIYALGVLLYELLTGKTPFDAKELLAIGLDEMRRTIREQEPPRPSTRLSTLPGQELSTTAQRRGLDAPKLVSELRGDLDWIVMKALEKDRARRYETANGLAMDIQRHLNNEPVVACPPSRLYRIQKLVRRNKLAFAASAAVAMALVIGSVVSMWHAARAQRAEQAAKGAEQAAKEEKDSAEAVLWFVRDKVLAAGRPEGEGGGLGIDTTLRQAIEAAESKIAKAFTNRPLVEAAIRKTLGESYLYLGEPALAIPQLERALAIRREGLGLENEHTVGTMDKLRQAYQDAGKPFEFLPFYEEALKLTKARRGPEHGDTRTRMHDLALAYAKAGKFDQAIALYEELLKLCKAKRGLQHPQTLSSMNNLAVAYHKAGKLDQGVSLYEETLKLNRARLGPEHEGALTVMDNLAVAYYDLRKFDQAIALHEETLKLRRASLGPEDSATVLNMAYLARAYHEAGKLDQAIPLLEETLRLRNARQEPDHPDTLTVMHNLALALWDAGKRDRAVPLFEETFKLKKAKLGPTHVHTLLTMRRLAVAYRETGQIDRALPLFEELLTLNTTTRGLNDLETVLTIEGLAKTYRRAGKPEQLAAMYREQVAQKTGHAFAVAFELGSMLLGAAKTNSDAPSCSQDLTREGEQLVREYLAAVRSRYTNDPLTLATRLADVAELRYRQAGFAEAAPLYREIVELRRPRLSANHKDVLEPTASLGRALSDWAWAERDPVGRAVPSAPSVATDESSGAVRTRRPTNAPVEMAREAERLLREVLAVRLRADTNSWRIGDLKSRLGGALVSVVVTDPAMDAEARQAKLSEAESLLLEGHERLQKASREEKYKRDALQRLVRLYEAWNKPDKRAEWQQKLELFDKGQKKSSGSEPLTQESLDARTKSK